MDELVVSVEGQDAALSLAGSVLGLDHIVLASKWRHFVIVLSSLGERQHFDVILSSFCDHFMAIPNRRATA